MSHGLVLGVRMYGQENVWSSAHKFGFMLCENVRNLIPNYIVHFQAFYITIN